MIPDNTSHFSVLNLKDTFFSVLLDVHFQDLSHPWILIPNNPRQLTWTVLSSPRDSKTVLTFLPRYSCRLGLSFLLSLPPASVYRDTLFVYSLSLSKSQSNIATLLNFFSSRSYWLSPSKAHLSSPSLLSRIICHTIHNTLP